MQQETVVLGPVVGPPEEQRAFDAFKENLERLLGRDDAPLRRDLGELGFVTAEFWLKRAQDLARRLEPAISAGLLWKNKYDELAKVIGQVCSTLDQMQTFAPQHERSMAERQQELIQELKKHTNDLFAQALPVLPHIALAVTDISSIRSQAERQVNTIVSSVRADVAVAQTELDKAKNEATSIAEALRSTAAEAGVAKHAKLFSDEAKSHGQQAWLWAATAALIGGFASFYIIKHVEAHLEELFQQITKQSNGGSSSILLVPTAISRLLLVSLLYVALVWCLRNFAASRHNAVVNRHRQNALSTFEAFVRAAEGDAQTKNAVLLQATQSIFGPQPSGYLKTDNDMPSGNQVIEIVRGFSEKNN